MNRIREIYASSELRKIVVFSTVSLLFEMALSLILLMYGVKIMEITHLFNRNLRKVRKNGYAIEYINNPSEQVQLAAVKEYSFSIQCIENPSEEVQLEAVRQNRLSIYCIENPSKKVKLEAGI